MLRRLLWRYVIATLSALCVGAFCQSLSAEDVQIGLGDLPQTFTLSESSSESMTVTIAGISFAGKSNVMEHEDGISSAVSDIATFQNNAKGQATICFAGDPSLKDCPAIPSPPGSGVFNLNASESAGPDVRFFGLTGTDVLLKVTISSDTDSGPEGTSTADSDSLTIEKTPEPLPSITLGMGILMLIFYCKWRSWQRRV